MPAYGEGLDRSTPEPRVLSVTSGLVANDCTQSALSLKPDIQSTEAIFGSLGGSVLISAA